MLLQRFLGHFKNPFSWFYSLYTGAIQGGANALMAYMGLALVHASGVTDIPVLNLKGAFTVFLFNAAYAAVSWLAKNPAPELKDRDITLPPSGISST